jgi:hypothetical protein
MLAIQSGKLRFGLMLATALMVSMLPAGVQAYTQDEQAACSNDAFRLCGPEIPDVDRITACMIRNKSQLSPESLTIRPASPRKPVSAKPRKPKKPAKPAAT